MEHCTIEKKDTGIFLSNEKKTKWVTFITFLTMVVEIIFGYWTGSMALLADGWHMASHTLALFLSLVVYYLYRHPKFRLSFTFGGGKILSLGGYTSSMILIFIAGSMIVESLMRLHKGVSIHYPEAIVVSIAGLVVNVICALILYQKPAENEHENCHHDHAPSKLAPAHQHGHSHNHHHGHNHHKDHNHESAYVHILTDAMTSVLAIGALVLGQWQGLSWLDPAVGVLGGVLVLKWSLGLIKQSGMDLLDAHDDSIDREKLVKLLEQDGSVVVDIHLWRLAPSQVGCEIIVKSHRDQKSADYRNLIKREFKIQHLIIEVV